MRYKIKKLVFFLLSISAISTLLVWFLFYLDAALGIGGKVAIPLTPDILFRDEAIMLPIFLSLLFLDLGFIILLIFYRKECRVWPKLLMLFTGTVATFTSLSIDSPVYTIGDPLPTGWTVLALILILLLFAAIALAAIIWLIVAMVKYPKLPNTKAA